jgi:uncharacterized protein YkwD
MGEPTPRAEVPTRSGPGSRPTPGTPPPAPGHRAWHVPETGIVVEESPAWVIPGPGEAASAGAGFGVDSLGRVNRAAARHGRTGFAETGLDRAGLDRAGLDTAGLDTAGLDAAGLGTAGLDTPGRNAAGFHPTARAEADQDEPTHTGGAHGRTKRRRTAEERRRASVRTAALTALGAGLAIALPAILRLPSSSHVTLKSPEASGPALAAPQDSADPADPGNSVGNTAPQGRAATAPQAGSSISASGTAASPATAARSTVSQGTASQSTVSPTTASQTTAKPATTAAPLAGPTTQISASLAAEYEDEVVTLTNAQRAAAGCGALHVDPRIQAAAVAHSVDMRARQYFAHNSLSGETPWQRMADQGYATPSAENIAMGQATPQDVVTAWMNSPGHRANILNCSSESIGVGVQFGPGGPWWTQDFGYV